MKKLLLTLAAAVCSFAVASAQDPITTDFFNVDAFADPSTTPVSKTIDNVDYTFMGSYVAEYFKKDAAGNYTDEKTDGYLFIKGKTTKGAYVTFKLPFACSKVVIKTTSGCSTNSQSALNFYAGETKLETKVVNEKSTEYTFSVPAANSAAGTVYKFESNTNKYNQQIQVITFYPVTSDPTLDLDPKELAFATVLNATQELTVKVLAANITENITVSSDNAAFVVPASVSVADAANGVVVKYTGTKAGEATAEITFSAQGKTATLEATAFTAAHAGTEADPLTVTDVLDMNNRAEGVYCVTGVVGALCAANAKDGMITEVADATKNVASNIILKEGTNMIGVALPSNSEAREKLNIVDNANVPGSTVIVKGTLENYFGAPGVKNTEFVKITTGVEAIEVENNAAVEYFNLQGVRVANPENGLFIRRQGNKVSKVLVK